MLPPLELRISLTKGIIPIIPYDGYSILFQEPRDMKLRKINVGSAYGVQVNLETARLISRERLETLADRAWPLCVMRANNARHGWNTISVMKSVPAD